ncbi:MAG: hypothetical protein A2001_13460, partial [Treponema sp. GWC1_61_84]
MNASILALIGPDGVRLEIPALAPEKSLPVESALDAIRRVDPAALDAPCGGAGTCGKCRVRVVSGDAGPVDAEEQRHLSGAELAAGIRLACRILPRGKLELAHVAAGGKAAIRETFSAIEGQVDPIHDGKGTYGIAVDIGTTTVAAYLVDFDAGSVVASASRLNRQRSFGADVIARIDYAGRGEAELEELASLVRADVRELADGLLSAAGARPEALRAISVVGNTIMLHLFAAVDPSPIAVAPFTPVFTELRRSGARDYGLPYDRAELLLAPSVAGYVGADIVAGIRATNLAGRTELTLLLDLGTNGEMALGDREGVVACATAAGPAFEGAAISCGTGGVAGAVDSLFWEDGVLEWTTIGGGDPIGICGSGIIDAAACLVEAGIADDTGALAEPWNTEGYPLTAGAASAAGATDAGAAGAAGASAAGAAGAAGAGAAGTGAPGAAGASAALRFTQADVRQIQLAKAAVAAGIASLLDERGDTVDDIAAVYLAGGFGSYLRPESAATIGLIPAALLPKVDAVGNAAGHGAVRMLLFKG